MKNKHPKDFFGNDIEVGDEVAIVETNYRNLVVAVVEEFTSQKVRVRPTSRYSWRNDGTTLRDSKDLIVNTEKKYREKALDALVAEAQANGEYD